MNYSTLLLKYLTQQGVTEDEWPEIQNPTESLENDPYLIKDSRDWLNLLYQNRDKIITIVGDYDADGVLSATVMRKGLQVLNIGKVVNTYVPTRMDGYGITPTSVARIKDQFPETEMIVTVDNGVAAFEGVQAAKNEGWIVLVNDHHLAKPEGLPVADAIVDINRPGDEYPFKGISGTAMAYKLLLGYAQMIAPNLVPMIKDLRVLVGISTVTDMMPMRHENRWFVKYALNEVQKAVEGIMTPHADEHIFTLVQTLKHKGKLYGDTVDEDLFGFTIGPMLNAASRVNGTPQLAYDLFMAEEMEDIAKVATDLINTNETRKRTVGKTASKIAQQFEQKFDNGDDIHALATTVNLTSGYVGLIAGNLQNQFQLPSIAFSTLTFDGEILNQPEDILHGSARSLDGISIVDVFREIEQRDANVILGYGGHAAAAGVTIAYKNFNKFNNLLNEVVAEMMASQPQINTTADTNAAYFDVKPEDITMGMLQLFDSLAPFGQDFAKPLYRLSNIDTTNPRFMGADKQHISFTLPNRMEVIKWNGASEFANMGNPNHLTVVGSIGTSEYMGRTKLQMIVENWQ